MPPAALFWEPRCKKTTEAVELFQNFHHLQSDKGARLPVALVFEKPVKGQMDRYGLGQSPLQEQCLNKEMLGPYFTYIQNIASL